MTATLDTTATTALTADFNGISSINATMSSRELAAITQTRHDNVKRTIEMLANKHVFSLPQIEEVKIKSERRVEVSTEYRLNRRDTMVVAARLNSKFMARVVDRWLELEQQTQGTSQPGEHQAELAHLRAKVAQLQAVALGANPRWAALARYRAMGLSRVEMAKLLDTNVNAIKNSLSEIKCAGLILAQPLKPVAGVALHVKTASTSTQATLFAEVA